MAVLLMIAGNETTTNLIGNGTLEILEHPEALRRLREDPSLVPGFIEETLRFRPPVRALSRRTTRDVTLRGVTIPANSSVFLFVESANRDPAEFPDPDRFDITRQPQTQITFGYGIHFCVGAPLARLEGRVAFEEMFRRLPAFSRDTAEPLAWQPSFGLRGLKRLPLLLDAPAARGRTVCAAAAGGSCD
jgi:cytochrome P450